MPEETRYITLSGKVPNGGIPPGRLFASLVLPPPVSTPMHYGPPPAYSPPPQPFYHTLHPGPPPPAPAAASTVAPAVPAPQASNPAKYEPPGQYVDDRMPQGHDWTLIIPSDLTTIYFLGDGLRPCDAPDGHYPHPFGFTKHKVPSVMTVADLIKQLGAPPGDHLGITEMEEVGNDRFMAGITITQGSDLAKKSLAEIGWTQRKSEVAPIWILVKR